MPPKDKFDNMIIHGNLYWSWQDPSSGHIYGRHNLHNIGLIGSVMDFDEIEPRDRELYLRGTDEATGIYNREALGAWSGYGFLIAHQNPVLLADGEFISKFIDTFLSQLPYGLRFNLPGSLESQQVLQECQTRKQMIVNGRRVKNRMEGYSHQWYAENSSLVLNLLDIISNR